ncbi:MAG: pentapeptide repeat-containing protein [Bradymonadia bacterium]
MRAANLRLGAHQYLYQQVHLPDRPCQPIYWSELYTDGFQPNNIDWSGLVAPCLHGAHLDFSFSDLRGADLRGAKLFHASFEGANLEGADLRGVVLYHSDLSHSNLQGARIGAGYEWVCVGSGGCIIGDERCVSRTQATWLYGVDLSGARVGDALNTVPQGNIPWARFVGTDLRGAQLEWSDLQGMAFDEADLTGASLYHSDLNRASFRNAVLHRANLSGAHLKGADLAGADMREAELLWVDFEGMVLTDTNLNGAIVRREQHIPDSITSRYTLQAHPEFTAVWVLNAR